ncbi:MAG TPA: condensation domain-containing protein, partial [Pseudomonadales bacterium]
MTAHELLSKARAAGIKLWLDGDELKFKAPKGAFTPEIKSQLIKFKPEVIAFLRNAKTIDDSGKEAIPKVDDAEKYPLSFAQQRLWFIEQLDPGDISYNIPIALRLTGAVDVNVLNKVFREIINRHEALRAGFENHQGEGWQRIKDLGSWAIVVDDLSELSEYRQEQSLKKFLYREATISFDLVKDTLIRAKLFRLSEHEAVLITTMHHIVSDGWSMGVLIKEVGILYNAFAQGLPSPLPPLEIQYKDFACWQRQWLQGAVLERQLDYWRKQLADVPVLELYTDKVRPAITGHQGAIQTFTIPTELSQKIKQLSQQQGTTLYMTLLAAFNILLYRYTGQADFAVGSPIANRTRPELEPLIGFFVNTLALRADLSSGSGGEPSFIECLKRVQATTLDAYDHQDIPFEKIVDELNIERSMSHTPLFQVMFVLQNAMDEKFSLPGLSLETIKLDRETAKFDLQLGFVEHDDQL